MSLNTFVQLPINKCDAMNSYMQIMPIQDDANRSRDKDPLQNSVSNRP